MLKAPARHRPGTSTSTLIVALFAALLLSISSAHAAKNTLQRGNGAEPETLDVHKSSGVPAANIQRDLFEGLVAEAADGSHVPGVAESWTLSDDGKVYTFRLRKNAKWSNGDAVTAHDFVFALQRGVDPAVGSSYAFILWPIANGEDITKGKVKELDRLGVEAVGAHTLKVTLKAPTPYFIGLLTHMHAYPVHRKTIERHGGKWTRAGNLVSNGAYRLAEWVPQSHIRLERNPHYWNAANVRIDAVVFHPTEDKSTELRRFRSGELDATDDVPSDQIAWVEKNLAAQFRNTAYLGTYYYALNLTKAPFRDRPGLRNALAMTIDREILTGKVTKGGEIPAYAWVPPGVNRYAGAKVSWAGLSKAERLAPGQEALRRGRILQGQPAEGADPVQHQRQPQAHRHRRRGHVETGSRRQDGAVQPGMESLPDHPAGQAVRSAPGRLDRRLQRRQHLSRAVQGRRRHHEPRGLRQLRVRCPPCARRSGKPT